MQAALYGVIVVVAQKLHANSRLLIKALFVFEVSIYIYHIFTYESLTSNSSVALRTIIIF